MSSLRRIQGQLRELLGEAYLADDIAQMGGGSERLVTAERLRTLCELGQLCGIRVSRKRCKQCGGFLPYGLLYMYCNNACKQRAYRVRQGQMRR